MLYEINDILINDYVPPTICIIGHNGNCASGVIEILDFFKLKYNIIEKDDIDKGSKMKKFDILYNCICLDNKYSEIWFDEKTIFPKNIVIVDISADYAKSNNPIKIYNNNTTFENPVYKYNNNVDIIAINNLPSLLPKDSSNYFSNILLQLLLNYNNNYWHTNLIKYYEMINKK